MATSKNSQGRNPEQKRDTVSRVPALKPETRDPLPSDPKNGQPFLDSHRQPRPGQQAPDQPTSATGGFARSKGPKRSSAPRACRQAGLQDQASKGGSPSIFERMGARNNMLGRRNRRSA